MKIKKLFKTHWFAPYVKKNGILKPNLKLLSEQFKTGVYFIRNKKTNKILYVGFSGYNLYKTIYRHFQSWQDRRQYRATFDKKNTDYQLQIIFCKPKQAQRLEEYFIKKYKEIGQASFNNYQYTTKDNIIKTNNNNSSVIDLETGKQTIDIITLRPDQNTDDFPF
jgi:hypothetical protein